MAEDSLQPPHGSADTDYANAEAARQLESDNPDWMVVFGVFTKEFVAFPLFAVPPHTVVVARYPGALSRRMREVERMVRAGGLRGTS